MATTQTSAFNPQRAQQRIDYLKKYRPQDSQLGQLQRRMAQMSNANSGNPQMSTGVTKAFNAPRAQQRIDYLKRARPNDPQIAALQRQLQQNAQSGQTGSTGTTGTTGSTGTTGANTQNNVNTGRIQARIDFLKRSRPNDPEIARLQQKLASATSAQTATPAATTATPAAAATPATTTQPANTMSPMTKALLEAFRAGTNTMGAYEPKNFEGSPLYQFQKQEGMKDLEKLMAARGLTNSGAEVEANKDFLTQLNAQEADKQRGYAEQEAQRALNQMQFIANLDNDQQQFNAKRQDDRSTLMTNFLTNILRMQADNNIANLSQGGLDKQTQLSQALMNAMASNAANNWSRSYGGGGTPPPPPSGNQNNLDLARILTGYGDNAGNNDFVNTIFNTLFGK